MKKEKLSLETLRVESFAASADAQGSAAAVFDAGVARTRPHICDPVTAWC